MGPFSVSARHRPEKYFPELIESALLLSLEKVRKKQLLALWNSNVLGGYMRHDRLGLFRVRFGSVPAYSKALEV